MNAIEEIAAERRRQVEAEGWTAEHDDAHSDGSMAQAAAAYAVTDRRLYVPQPSVPGTGAVKPFPIEAKDLWPSGWGIKWWKPKTRRHNLIRAGALIVAEIERLDRTAK